MGDNGKPKTVDFTEPDEVVSLLRQRGASLASSAIGEDGIIAELADAVAILMFVTAQGMEMSTKQVRPTLAVPPRIDWH